MQIGPRRPKTTWTRRHLSRRRSLCFRVTIAVLVCAWASVTLARQGQLPHSLVDQSLKQGIPVVELTAIDPLQLRNKHLKNHLIGPRVFAEPIATDLTIEQAGRWRPVAGGYVWQLNLRTPGATDSNLGFSQFYLPPGSQLFLISNSKGAKDYFQGPFTQADNQAHGQFWSPILPGSDITLELFVPSAQYGHARLRLAQVGAGFLDAFELFGGPGLKNHGSCNIDAVCPEGDGWRDEIRSVARFTINGSGLCTGTMLMDTAASFRPLFVTAFHCGVTATSAPSVVTYWNYMSPNCGDQGGGSLAQALTGGATFLAGRLDVDSTLIELNSSPPASYDVFWSGWDRSGIAPMGSVGIHHPRGDVKSLSFNDDELSTSSSCIASTPASSHWIVDNWESGTTEPGSSGSGIWDPDSKLLVGFLSGGAASCGNPAGLDCYGKLSVAWAGGNSDAQRLGPWLDPTNTGATSVAGDQPPPPEPDPFCSEPALAIPDNQSGGISDSLTVSSTASLQDLDVTLSVAHTYVGDLAVSLVHVPSGVSVGLLDRPGVPASPNGCSADNIDAVFDDAADVDAEDACASTGPALSGRLRPAESLSAFNGQTLGGLWRLQVSDNVAIDTGTLLRWCLRPTTDASVDLVFSDGFE